jgi:hypothetical protein
MKPFPAVRNLKKDFPGEGSSLGYSGRTFKDFVDIFIFFFETFDAFGHF